MTTSVKTLSSSNPPSPANMPSPLWTRSTLTALLHGLILSNASISDAATLLPHKPHQVAATLRKISTSVGNPASWTDARHAKAVMQAATGHAPRHRPRSKRSRKAPFKGRLCVQLVPATTSDEAAVRVSAMNPFVEVMLRSTRRVWDIVTHLYHKWSIPVYLLANGQLLNVADNVSDLVPATDRVLRVSYAIVNLNIDWRIMRHALHDAPPLSPRRPAKRRRSTSPPSSQPSPAIPQIPLPPPPSLPPQRFIGSRRTYASPPSTQDASQNPSPPSHPSPSAKRPKFIPQSPPVQRVQDPHARDDDDFWTGNVPFSPAPLVTNALTACNKAVAFSSAAQSSTGQVQKARQQPSKVARRRARSCNTSESILNLVSTITAPTHASQVAQSGEHAVMQRLRSHLEQLQPHQPQLVPNASAHTIPSTNDLSVSLGNRSDVPQIPDAFLKTATIFEIPPIETSLPDSLLSLGHSNLQIDTPPNSNLVKDIRHQSAQQVQSEGKEQDPESDDEKLDIHLLDNLPDVVQPSAGEHVKDMPTVDVPVDLLCPENLDDDDFNLGKHVFGDSILFQTTDANRLKTGDSASVGGIGGNGSLNFSGLLSRLNEES